MGEVHYMISEAAKRVNVETHVLRYWEEELSLSIGRTEMGHRYYTEDDIQLFAVSKN
ncbi:MAG: MerR family transcriptional regulator [Lachnospiraceae bacterium]